MSCCATRRPGLCDLAPVRDPAPWVEALARTLGIRPEGSSAVLVPVIDRLQGRDALIVLDNFEHGSVT